MNATRRWALSALLFGGALSALAQDAIVLGSPLVAAPGEVVRVPLFLRDVEGTPLGAQGQAPIQWIDFSITHSHPQYIVGCLGTTYPNCDLRFEGAGQLTATRPEISGTLIHVASLYVRRIFPQALAFRPGELEPIGFIDFRLDPNTPLGTVIQLRVDPTKTFLANHDRTIVEDKELALNETTVRVTTCLDPPGTPSFDFLGPISQCSSRSSVCRAGEDVEFQLVINPFDPCDTLTWSFGDGTTATNVATVRHRFPLSQSLISPYSPITSYTVSATLTRAGGSAVFSRRITIEPGCTATVPETAVAGVPVPFTADTVPPGLSAFVSWKFGDGTTGVGNPIQHTYQFGLTYLWEASLTVTGAAFPCIVRRPIEISGPTPPKRRPIR